MENNPSALTDNKKPMVQPKRGRWVLYLLLLMVVLGIGLMYLVFRGSGAVVGGFGPWEMQAAQYTPKDVLGDLGGMKVKIPRHMAEFVEYEGDPSWGEQRKGPIPERTYQSKLTSFGVQFRYPDMATLSSPEMWKDKRSKTIYETDWMDFGVNTGSRYSTGALDRIAHDTVQGLGQDAWNSYEALPKKQYGLTVYALKGLNPKTGQPNRLDNNAKDEFVAFDKNGKVLAYMKCSNVAHEAAPCAHHFSLEAQGVQAHIYVGYRRAWLKDWKDIQQQVTQLVLSFKTSAN